MTRSFGSFCICFARYFVRVFLCVLFCPLYFIVETKLGWVFIFSYMYSNKAFPQLPSFSFLLNGSRSIHIIHKTTIFVCTQLIGMSVRYCSSISSVRSNYYSFFDDSEQYVRKCQNKFIV